MSKQMASIVFIRSVAMKLIAEIKTPAILLDLAVLEKNLNDFQVIVDNHGKNLWPMIKTHKSTEIANMQYKRGAKGFLCGTLDECEALARSGMKDIGIMYAYPVANQPSISRAVKLAADCDFSIRIDNYVQAQAMNDAAKNFHSPVVINYLVIINSGLDRLGIVPHDVVVFMEKMSCYENLKFRGISTHPGHVYSPGADVSGIERDEVRIMAEACEALGYSGIFPDIVSSGSTPTFHNAAMSDVINTLHPGNYVFMDNIQVALNRAQANDCALSVLTSVISGPRLRHSPERGEFFEFIIDAGSKCLGDQGVHGSQINSLGHAKNHPELEICSLSEEVGRVRAMKPTSLKIGDKIEIIPNHSCSTANMTSYYIGVRGGMVDRDYPIIAVDMSGNSKP